MASTLIRVLRGYGAIAFHILRARRKFDSREKRVVPVKKKSNSLINLPAMWGRDFYARHILHTIETHTYQCYHSYEGIKGGVVFERSDNLRVFTIIHFVLRSPLLLVYQHFFSESVWRLLTVNCFYVTRERRSHFIRKRNDGCINYCCLDRAL